MITNRINTHIINILFTIVSIITISCKPVKEDPIEYKKQDKTILIYMEANNNLSDDAIKNIKLIQNGELPAADGNNIIVYAHNYDKKPKLLRIYGNNNIGVIDTVYHFPDINSATTDALKNAMNITKTMFPSDEFGLILWSHGTGWLPQGYYSNPTKAKVNNLNISPLQSNTTEYVSPWQEPPGGIDPYAHLVKSFGSQKRSTDPTILEMEIPQLAEALPFNPDYIIFDACLMGGIELAYEFKDKTKKIVFSPAEVLSNGLEYGNMMKYLLAKPTNLIGVAENAYNYYNSQYDNNRSLTISVIDLEKLDDVANAAKEVFKNYRQNIASLNISSVQPYFRYNKYWFFDINDYIKQICGKEGAEYSAAFTNALNNAILYKATTGRIINLYIDINKYSGISTYIPYHPNDETLNSYYKKYKWELAVESLAKE